ncbi:TMEM165/GDT1 family protein [Natronococcus sp. JC468]|uniref:TMEM165/GDT1 family protein n=1 Tax=Natronococcus sp. JC468 TaxID=1961921 RepID=UPI00143A0D01|nr:TMEM165/GDT1 family protein [Natronococcus sp. JC468]NKE35358.1 TMEM165/GDT1 family protein [Natronococcus sp. JC468]
MTDFVALVAIAAVAQLAVLPGEKVQFIIAGLSTRYEPLLVVGAAGAAFGGWTALEILFGRAIQGVLPGIALDAMTAGLFLLFAVLLVRSAPDDAAEPGRTKTDGGITGAELPGDDTEFELFGRTIDGPIGHFLAIFTMMAVGEFGDKTQLVTIGLAVEYGASPAIWLGEMLAIVPVSVANAYFFHRFAHRFDARKAHYVGAALFAFFGLDTVLAILTGFSAWERVIGSLSELIVAVA